MPGTHGLASTYKVYGCRCAPCVEANTNCQRTYRAQLTKEQQEAIRKANRDYYLKRRHTKKKQKTRRS
jgi:hypothetical protein